MKNFHSRLSKLETTINRESLYLRLVKIYCECEGIHYNVDEYPSELEQLKWDDIFGSNQLIMENYNGIN